MSGTSLVGVEQELVVEKVAHGGHCVARHDGLVYFVRHTLPGERVRARVLAGRSGDRFVLAEAVEILEASPHRVPAPCRFAGPAGCGGCDFQHAELSYQRELKTAVVREQLERLGGYVWTGTVEAVPGDEDGLRWRTRMDLAVDRQGRTGLHPHRSREVLDIDECLIATQAVNETGIFVQTYPRAKSVHACVTSEAERAVVVAPQGKKRTPTVHETVTIGGEPHTFRLNALGFWQVHPGAPATFAQAVLGAVQPQPGEHALDLYAGVGLFARALADAVGGSGRVVAIESDHRASLASADQFAGDGHVEVWEGRVDEALGEISEEAASVDIVVLDPPRTGAGREVIERIARLRPRVVAYVACDPAALGRDIAYAREAGLVVRDVRAFDAFPMTQHVECLATLVPAEPQA